MKNYEVLSKDPRSNKLPNEGVAKVKASQDQAIVMAELAMFVCEGQYKKGIEQVLTTYRNNITKGQQPSVWISGFYGSGKSHLVKVLRYLWTNEEFAGKQTARDIADLPADVTDLLKELDSLSKQEGGRFAAAGVLEAGPATQLPKAILGIVYESLGLPNDVGTAEFVLWMRRKGIEDKVIKDIEAADLDYSAELDAFRVSTDIADSLRKHDKALGSSADGVLDKLNEQFPKDTQVSVDKLVKSIEHALKETHKGKFPCTLLILDEAQQYIGNDADRGYQLQLAIEALSSRLDGKLIVVATGQSALNSTALLSKLQDRFTRQLHLQDNDIETVIRRVVLQKRADKKAAIQKMLDTSEGEITRQLQGTKIEAVPEDKDNYVDSYPVLPVRQRFWEKMLRNVDTGLTGQLRTQLRITYEAVRGVADKPLGNVIPADMLFDQLADALVEKGVLDRDRHNGIQKMRASAKAEEQLASRLFALIFMIGKINQSIRDTPNDLGIRANAATLADLLVEDLQAGGTELRERIPKVLTVQAQKGALLQVGDEFRLQTPESAAWEQHYQTRLASLMNNDGEISYLRSELFRRELGEMLDDVVPMQGKAKMRRRLESSFTDTPPSADQAIPVWVRTEWDVPAKTVATEAHAAGVHSPLVTVFIPKVKHDELKQGLAAAKAAEMTLQEKGTPATRAGEEARDAIHSRKTHAEQHVRELVYQLILKDTKVILAGNDDFPGITLLDKIRSACESALARLYPNFTTADSDKWQDVFKRAKAGDGAPLQVLNYNGEPEKHPVCKAIVDEIGAGKKGAELRKKFTAPPYGWPQDAVDAAIMVLMCASLLRASKNGQPVLRQAVEQSTIGALEYRLDHPPIGAMDKIKLRGLFTKAGIKCQSNDDVEIKSGEFVAAALQLAANCGGPAPLPDSPNTSYIKSLQNAAGNEQLAEILQVFQQLETDINAWSSRKKLADQRLPRWNSLKTLLKHAATGGLPVAAEVQSQVDAIEQQRLLLEATDPVPPLCKQLGDALRQEIQKLHGDAKTIFDEQSKSLDADPNWAKLGSSDAAARDSIASRHALTAPPAITVGTEDQLISELDTRSLSGWKELSAAIPTRFTSARNDAIAALEPKAQYVKLPSATLKTQDDVDAWLAAAKDVIVGKLKDGPVIL